MTFTRGSVTSQPAMTELLTRADVIDELRQWFRSIQENMTTSIREAAALTDLTEPQLRYAESREMLAPNREEHLASDSKGQRRYTTDDLLRARLIAFFLSRNYSFADIALFMRTNPDVVHDVLQTSGIRLKTAKDNVDAIQFSRFVIPRLAYFALSLVFERDAVANVGFIIPVRADSTTLDNPPLVRASSPPEQIDSPDDLGRLGQILVAWRPANGPLITLLTRGNPFEREQKVLLTPLAELLPEGSPLTDMAQASGILLAYAPQARDELDEASNTLKKRRASNPKTPGPRQVATRLICEAQRIFQHRLAMPYGDTLDMAKMQVYSAPELDNPALGDALLNGLADTIVRLGGVTDTGEWKWRFSSILTPRDLAAPFRQQELVVRAQSRLGPHRIGVTTTSPTRNGGLTYRAFSSGRIVYRDMVTPLDPAISYIGIEGDIKSAVATPTVETPGAERGQPSAVIYVTALKPEEFDADDMLLLRVLGRVVGEIVQTYNSRGHRPAALTDALANPEIVDPFFSEFKSDSDFTRELSDVFSAIIGDLPPKDDPGRLCDLMNLTLVGLDINDFARIERARGPALARLLMRAVGLRAKQRIEGSFSRGAERVCFCHEWGDRFYALIRDEELDVVKRRIGRIHRELSGMYTLEGNTVVTARTSAAPTPGAKEEPRMLVAVRMVGMTLSKEELSALIGSNTYRIAEGVASLSRRLEDGLQQAGERTDSVQRMLWWQEAEHAFEPEPLPEAVASTQFAPQEAADPPDLLDAPDIVGLNATQ